MFLTFSTDVKTSTSVLTGYSSDFLIILFMSSLEYTLRFKACHANKYTQLVNT